MEAFQIEGKDGYRKDIREVNAKKKKKAGIITLMGPMKV